MSGATGNGNGDAKTDPDALKKIQGRIKAADKARATMAKQQEAARKARDDKRKGK